MFISKDHAYRGTPGGGGTLNIYWHLKGGGGLRHGYNPKKGGLRHGNSPKKGLFGTGTSRKRGVLRTGLVKKTILVTDVAQKGGLGAYLLIIFIYFL